MYLKRTRGKTVFAFDKVLWWSDVNDKCACYLSLKVHCIEWI